MKVSRKFVFYRRNVSFAVRGLVILRVRRRSVQVYRSKRRVQAQRAGVPQQEARAEAAEAEAEEEEKCDEDEHENEQVSNRSRAACAAKGSRSTTRRARVASVETCSCASL
jgi:hypothetical protein